MTRPICWLLTVYYAIRYGAWNSGHSWANPIYYPARRDGQLIEVERWACERCGATDAVWRYLPEVVKQ